MPASVTTNTLLVAQVHLALRVLQALQLNHLLTRVPSGMVW